MTARRKAGIAALKDAEATAQPLVTLVDVNDIPRAGISPTEFAQIFGMNHERVLDLIAEGVIEVLDPKVLRTRNYVIPVSELCRLQQLQVRLNATA